MKTKKVVFIFSHAMLINVWKKAEEYLRGDLIDVLLVNQSALAGRENDVMSIIENADAVYISATRHFPAFDKLVESCKKAGYVVPSGIESSAAFEKQDASAVNLIEEYFKAGTALDFANAVRFLLYKSGYNHTVPSLPSKQLLCGIYHPDAEQTFANLCEYLKWKETSEPDVWSMPTVAICFPRTWILSADLAMVNAVIEPLHSKAFEPLLVFCDGELASGFGTTENNPLDKILSDCGSGLSAIWFLLAAHASGRDETGNPFTSYNVPVFQIIRNYNQTVDEWKTSGDGLSAMSICYSLTKPEMLGCVEPQLLGCNEMVDQGGINGKAHIAVPVMERIERCASRTQKWHILRTRPNTEKRVAIMLHNAPCKGVEATIATAAGLNAAQSAVDILIRLKCEGYSVCDIPRDGKDLIDLIVEKKAISEFRWTNVEEIESKGGAIAHIYRKDYMADFETLPDAIKTRINDAWEPFPGEAMVSGKDGDDPSLLITGIWFGNILVMVEPKRGCWGPKCDGEVCRILHDPDIPPPHQWFATYWYLQKNVDALISLGTESPVEYLPGKRAALSAECYPEITLGNLPVIYPYIFSAVGEGLMAKRRGRGVLIDHLTPSLMKLTDTNSCWAEMETLYVQYCTAQDVKDTGRLSKIEVQLQGLMEKAGLLKSDFSLDEFELRIKELPRRIEQLRKRFVEKKAHVLGNIPDEEAVRLYINEATGNGERQINEEELRQNLSKVSVELDRVIDALSARFINPGPGGHLSRGKTEVLPTGRNIYATDLRAIPTRAAWETGVSMGEMILRKYIDEEGCFPQSIAITLWSSDVFRADGELISQGLWLCGCRPKWNSGGRVTGIELIPSSELTMKNSAGDTIRRPRVDIIIQMSGIVRDTLPEMYMMLDEAVEKAASTDEPGSENFIRAHVNVRMAELQKTMNDADVPSLRRLARCRVFSSKPGSYGTGVGLAIDAAAWEDDKDLAETYINWAGFAYGKNLDSNTMKVAVGETAVFTEYSKLMGAVDIAYQKAIGPEYDAMSIGCYSSFQGGMAAVNRAVGTGSVKMYWGDSSSSKTPEIRSLAQEIDESLFAKLFNPDWIDEKKKDSYTGAKSVSCMINTLFHWSASARVITDEQFDTTWRTWIENEENRQWLHSSNIYALEEVTRRLLEASSRMLWNASEDKVELLQQTMLTIEGDIEESMGPVKGEFQGSSVDIKKRKDVEKWRYAYTLR